MRNDGTINYFCLFDHFDYGLSLIKTFGVNFEMLIQMGFSREVLFTIFTLESLFANVNHEMTVQTDFLGESLVTIVTLERLFSCVNCLMKFQTAAFGKSGVT